MNWYPEKIESGTGQAPYVLYPTPGFSTFCTLATTPFRGAFTLNGATFAVGGGSLYQLPFTSGGSATLLVAGLSNPDDSPVSIVGNGDAGGQLLIASGSTKYSYDILTQVLTEQTASATQVGFINGSGIALDPARSEFSLSEPEDFATWDPLDIAQRNDAADKWLAMLVVRKEVWLFGSKTTSLYYDSGATFPIVPNPSVFLQVGITAPWSAAILGGSPIWLGQGEGGGGVVYQAQGYTPQRISTHAVEYAFSTYATLLDAEAFTYEDQGHSFYVLTFPTADATWVFDGTTGLWHERGDWDGTDWTSLAIRGHVFAGGVHLTGNRSSGAIYAMSTEVATTTAGTGIRRLRRAPHVASELKETCFDRFQLDLEVGIGLATGQGSNPLVNLSWSDDGGQTFGMERTVTAGRIGAYRTRAIWRRLGQAPDRVFQVTCADPVPWRLVDAFLDARGS